jgi:hypothetical protein
MKLHRKASTTALRNDEMNRLNVINIGVLAAGFMLPFAYDGVSRAFQPQKTLDWGLDCHGEKDQ